MKQESSLQVALMNDLCVLIAFFIHRLGSGYNRPYSRAKRVIRAAENTTV